MNAVDAAPLGVKPMAVIYLRVSTKDQAGRGGEVEGFSIPAQREACIRKAESLGAVVVAEFADAGESARSANRPELKNMLTYVKEHKIKHVVVHKVDRLARNRVDDVEINVQLSAAGAALVSCSENIDETPSGMLMHGIMSSIAEFYSRNLATEAKKGMRQKAKNGGTTSMAPFGYVNTRHLTDDGREVRAVEVDSERSRWVQWVFERYATGEWTAALIRDELNRQGVTTRQRPQRASRPLALSHIYAMLSNRYYVGVVNFEGVEYPGNHESLVSEELFYTVQRVRRARHASGEKPRVHSHYLKGSVYCGECGEPLGFGQSRNRVGNLYDYFYCLGRKSLRNGCTFRSIQSDQLEDLVVDHWATITLHSSHVAEIRQLVLDHFAVVFPNAVADRQASRERLDQLEQDSKKILDAFYADAIDTHELKREQARIAGQRAACQTELNRLDVSEQVITRHLDNCLGILTSAQQHYKQTDELGRRELNQGVFERLYVHDDEVVASDLRPAFRRLLSDDLPADLATERKTDQTHRIPTKSLWLVPEVSSDADRGSDLAMKDLPAKHRRAALPVQIGRFPALERPRGRLPWEKKEPRPAKDRGSNELLLVGATGIEPVTARV